MILKRRAQQKILAEELASHVEQLTEDLIGEGHTPQEAQYEARRRFGNQTALLEASREVWRWPWLDALMRDLLFTWRLARKQPWTMLAAVASIAIGIGANTAVTSVVDMLLLNPLGLKEAQKIVAATVHIQKLQMTGSDTSGAEFRDLQSSSDAFSAVTATEPRDWTLGGDQPERLIGVAVTTDYFRVFRVKPQRGTLLTGSNPNAIVVSDGFWKARFGHSDTVIGQKLILDGKPFYVVGVAPPDFHYPAKAEAWVPLILPSNRFERGNNMNLSLYARLRDGVSLPQAQQRVNHELVKLRSTQDGREMDKLGYGIDVEPLSRRVAGDLRLPLLFLWLAAFLLLIAACANVAGLLMARGASRRKEIAIRVSIGASKWQILRQLMTESLLIALLGGATGLAVASLLLGILKQQPLPYQHLLTLVELNGRFLLYGLGLALFSSLVFGLAPAIELLRSQHVGAMVRSRRKWFQNLYIVGQVSAAMLLLVVMGLLLKSLNAIELLTPGFDARGLTTAFLIKPSRSQSSFYERFLANLRTSPAVESAALAYTLPFAGNEAPTSMFDIKSHHHLRGQPEWHGEAYQVSPDYFKTLRIPLLRGRMIQDSDTAKTPHVCVIDEGFARRFFGNEDPLNQEIAMYGGWARIVGVVASVRDEAVEQESRPVAYYALSQIPYFPEVGVVVRSAHSAASLIRSAVAKADPTVPIFDMKTMEERINASESVRALTALLVTVFAGISILLAAIGIHGVASQVITERTAEIGIRMALGARASDIFRRYIGQGLHLAAAGVLIGLCAAAGCAGLLRSLLYQVQPMDPAVLLLGAIGVVAISLMAVVSPAWRASHVDPQIALRSE